MTLSWSYSRTNHKVNLLGHSDDKPLRKITEMRLLAEVLPSQVIEMSHVVKVSGDVPQPFSINPCNDTGEHNINDDYFLRCMTLQRYVDNEEEPFPSFTVTLSAI